MKKLKAIEFNKIVETKNYIVMVDKYVRYVDSPQVSIFKGTGKEAIDLICDTFGWVEWLEEEDTSEMVTAQILRKFFKYAESLNGDGWDYIEVFEY
jgi:hypothetical protein